MKKTKNLKDLHSLSAINHADAVNYCLQLFSCTEEDIFKRSREPKLVQLRHCISYALAEYCGVSKTDIGKYIGVDHSTIIHSLSNLASTSYLITTPNLAERFYKLKSWLEFQKTQTIKNIYDVVQIYPEYALYGLLSWQQDMVIKQQKFGLLDGEKTDLKKITNILKQLTNAAEQEPDSICK